MPLCKPKTKTLALLAACRGNARKGTGPRTAEGKRHSRLNALKHGRYSPNFRENLLQAGREADLKRFDFIRSTVLKFLPPVTQEQKRRAEEVARAIWCWAEKEEKRLRTKRRSTVDSVNCNTVGPWLARFQFRDQKGRTLLTASAGYQRRRQGGNWRLARVPLTLTPGEGSRVYQESQEMWRAAWVICQATAITAGARPIPKSFKELEQVLVA